MTSRLRIPTIGIGAGPHCDGQVLVSYDVLGLYDGIVPPFVKRYARLGSEIVRATKAFADEVRSGVYPEIRDSHTSESGGGCVEMTVSSIPLASSIRYLNKQ